MRDVANAESVEERPLVGTSDYSAENLHDHLKEHGREGVTLAQSSRMLDLLSRLVVDGDPRCRRG